MTPDFYILYHKDKQVGNYPTLIEASKEYNLNHRALGRTIQGLSNHTQGYTAREGYNDPELDKFSFYLYKHFRITIKDIEEMYGKRAIEKHSKEYIDITPNTSITTDAVHSFHLSKDAVVTIYQLGQENYTHREIAKMFNKSRTAIRDILNGKSHTRLHKEYHSD